MGICSAARRAATAVMDSPIPAARATAVVQLAARVGHDVHPALGVAAGAVGVAVVAAEQVLGRYEEPEDGYAGFGGDR